jgi:hypothetical protein
LFGDISFSIEYQLSEYNYNAFNGQMQAAHACDPAVTSSQNFDPQYYSYQGYETDLSGSQHMNQFYHSQESFISANIGGGAKTSCSCRVFSVSWYDELDILL